MANQVKTKFSVHWIGKLSLFSFIFMIGFLGLFTIYMIVIPLYLIGLLFRPVHRLGDWVMREFIALLMWMQPWFNADIQLNIPNENCLLISNHRSHLDAFILLKTIPGIRMLARSSLFRVPFLGLMMYLSKQIPAARGEITSLSRAVERATDMVHSGERVLIFPEMTRCEPGFKGTQAFSLLPFQAAFKAKLLIVPIVFKRTDEVWPKGENEIHFDIKVSVKSLESIDSAQFPSVLELKDFVQAKINQELNQ